MDKHKISFRRAANLFVICRKELNKSFLQKKDCEAEKIVKDFALNYPSYGYRMITAKLRLEGHHFNHKKVYRIYKKLKLNFKKNSKSRKLPARKRILEIANKSNQIWSLDFMSGSVNNRRFRTLNVIDEFAREVLDIRVLRSIPSTAVIAILNQIITNQNRKPLALRIDNGSEFTSHEFTAWARDRDIALFYIQAGKPYQNCYIERFNGTYRNEVLNKYIFDSLDELKEITDDWLYEYNHKRPHSSLGGLPPKIFLESQRDLILKI